MTQRNPPHRDRAYLAWVRRRAGECCICHGAPAVDLHHIEPWGMGRKCSDYLVAPVCRKCHEAVQGKGRIALMRMGENGIRLWADLCEAALRLLAEWRGR